ncbi:putative membrane protein [uncultured delta proteobacterium]|uniref:Putative membrane protein n=1 Tax=uncultured delta proteobacterium TaxID=34034 RepID=A0A212JAZ3_9DELT|nr:putative membrane protein [uncultured delta proteobacterium]
MTSMAISPDMRPPGPTGNLGSFLRAELAPYPGRFDAVVRYAVCITLVILLTFFLQLPFLDLGIIVIFFTVMENTVLTYLSSALVICGALLVGVLDNLVLGLTIDSPPIRITFSSLLVFFGMYVFRVVPLIGNIGYMAALSVIFLQANMAVLPAGELMLRLNLWSTVVSVYPAILACIVCTLVRPDFPSRSLPREAQRQLGVVIRMLEDKIHGEASRPLSPDMVERDLSRLHRLLAYASLEKKEIRSRKTRYLARLGTIDRLRIAAAHLSRLPSETNDPETLQALHGIRSACLDFCAALETDAPFRQRDAIVVPEASSPHAAPLAAELGEMRDALQALASVADAEYPPEEGAKMPLLAPDATTNPTYVRFALKTVLATLVCLGFYKSTQWEGIHTCMLTCIIMAQPSLGATAQKGLLRVSGCLIGSAIALLISVSVIPHLDDITWYILLCLAVLLPAAWITVGSPRSSYAGVQIAFAYALALMTSSGPSVNLAEIRDRLIGIMVGVAVSTVIHTLIWPEKEESSLRRSMADLLRAAASMAEGEHGESAEERQARLREAESRAWSLLSKIREIRAKVILEPDFTATDRDFARHSRQWLNDAQDLLFALHARLAAARRLPEAVAADLRAQADALTDASLAAPPSLTRLQLLPASPPLKPLEDAPA